MDKTLFVANWKSHKTANESREFLWQFAPLLSKLDLSHKQIVLCPSFISLPTVHDFVMANNLPIQIGSQNISGFEDGAFTGEVNAKQIKEFATHVIIGHSERKNKMHETADDIKNKVERARSEGLQIILCVQDENDTAVEGVQTIAYEPPSAIGSGEPDSPEHIEEVFSSLKQRYPESILLYGGSVTDENITEFMKIKNLGGFLVGGASLDPHRFVNLISV